MRDFVLQMNGLSSFKEEKNGELELSLKDQLIERLERRFEEHQASLRFITVGSLAMALSACKDDSLVQGSDGDDVLGNTAKDQIFKGRLGNDVYSYLMSGTDEITDTGGNDELRVSVVDAEGVSIQTSFNRVGDDLVVTQSGEGNSVTVVGAFDGSTALEQVTLVYEDGNRPDNEFDLIATAGDSPDGNVNMFVGTEDGDTIESAQSGWFFGAGGNDAITIENGSNTVHGGAGDDVITLGDGDDKVYAGDGDDVINAGLGANEVFGQAGNDIVLAAGGDDLIVGGTGDDILSGGEGFDDFMFNTNDGNDQITDFNVDEDTLTLVGFGYEGTDQILSKMIETYDGSVIFKDQGTQIRLAGLTLDDAENVFFVLRSSSDTGDDLGALSAGGGGSNSSDDAPENFELPEFASALLEAKSFTTSTGTSKVTAGSSTNLSMLANDTKASLGMSEFRESDFSHYKGSGYSVAVLDTGIDLNHPAFGPDDDNDGVSDRILFSQDFSSDRDGTADDVDGHGSNVASIIGSSHEDYLGVAPEAGIIGLQVLSNSGTGRDSEIESGLQWVIENANNYNIVAVNMSLGGSDNHNQHRDAPFYHDELTVLKDMGIITLVAAGNDYYGWQALGPYEADIKQFFEENEGSLTEAALQDYLVQENLEPFAEILENIYNGSQIGAGVGSPASDPNVIPVGAVWKDSFGPITMRDGAKQHSTASDHVAVFSQRSFKDEDGSGLNVVFAEGAFIDGAKPGGGVSGSAGTSQATPFVAGMVAVAQEIADDQLGRRLTPDEFEAMLLSSSTTIFDGDDEDDNVTNLDAKLPRVDILALSKQIKALGENDTDPISPAPVADDFGNDVSTNGVLQANSTVKGNLETPTDADWLKVIAEAGHSYTVSVDGATTDKGTLKDPFVSVFDADGKFLASNDDGGIGTDAQLSLTIAESDVFFVAVSSFGSSEENSQGTYEVTLKDNGIVVSDDYSADLNTTSLIVIDKDDNTGAIQADLEQLGDKDWHAVVLKAGEEYTVQLNGTEGSNKLEDPYLKIYDGEGKLLASDDDGGEDANSMLRFSPNYDGRYFVEASAYNNEGAGQYQVVISRIEVSNDIPQDPSTTAAIIIGETFNGELEFAGDRDWVKVELNAGTVYKVQLQGDQSGDALDDPYLLVRSGQGGYDIIAENDDFEGLNSGFSDLSIPTSGTYFLSAGSYGDEGTGAYTLSVEELSFGETDIPNDTTTTYTFTEYNETSDPANSVWIHNSILDGIGDRDWLKAHFDEGRSYGILLEGNGETPVIDTVLRIYDESGNLVGENDDAAHGSGTNFEESTYFSYIHFTATYTGFHYLEAAAYNDEYQGGYSFSHSESNIVDDFPLNLGTDSQILADQALYGRIDVTGDEDYFSFTTTPQAYYEITLEGSADNGDALEDPFLHVVDNDGDLLAVNDDFGSSRNSKLTFVPDSAETVFIVASAFEGTGDYVLNVSTIKQGVSDDHANDFSTTSEIALGEFIDGTLEEFDFTDMFVVQLQEGLSYDMAVLGYSFDNELTLGDPTLTLFDINSNMLEFNDDGTGMGLDPSLENFAAPYSGNYFIAVNAFSGGKGTYKVVVEVSRPVVPLVDDHANNLQTTSRLLVNETGSGTLETPGDEDIFVISLDENVSYSLSVEGFDSGGGSLVDPVFTVLDGVGNLLGGNDDGGIGFDPFIDSFVPSYGGDHFISVYAYDDSIGTYQIKAYATQDDHSDDHFNATRLELEDLSTYPVSTAGYITPNDTDAFVIGMEPGNQYNLVVDTEPFAEKEDTSPFNSLLELYSPGGLLKLASNNGSEEFKGSVLTFNPEVEGDYILAVLASNEGEYGGYNIGVYEIPSIV